MAVFIDNDFSWLVIIIYSRTSWLEPRCSITMDESNTFLSPQGFPPNTING